MESFVESVLESLPGYLIKIVGVFVVFFVGRWVGVRLANVLQRSLDKRNFDPTLTKFFGNAIRTLVLLVVILACLSIFGIETTSIAAILAAAGFAVGMALQGSLSNFAAGVLLVVFRPYRVGQVVKVAGTVGKVEEVALFTTTLDTPDNRRVIVPNGQIFGAVIENISFHETRRADVAVGADYSADIDATRAALERAITNVSTRLEDGAHAVVLTGLGDSSVDWSVRVWCAAADYWPCMQETTRAVKMALDEAGIGIPFPQMDVHLDGKLDKAT